MIRGFGMNLKMGDAFFPILIALKYGGFEIVNDRNSSFFNRVLFVNLQ
jgi:hypothetical protein